MITETNYQLLNKVRYFKPEDSMFTSEKEINYITEKLQLNEMSELQLRNLRDFIVASLSIDVFRDGHNSKDRMDTMLSITSIIDNRLFQIGAGV